MTDTRRSAQRGYDGLPPASAQGPFSKVADQQRPLLTRAAFSIQGQDVRYVIKPKGWYDAESVEPTNAPSIQIEPSDARKTGLVDAKGNDIWSQPDPIGFRFEDNKN